ncbi:MAG: hypothetical protein RJB68_2148 [Pseudomonadota bacterium]|jgi:hypothetical protein
MNNWTHITQCDAPEYLPFARSRIKAMRATGLKYASQQFDVNGVLVRVRTEGDQSYISISGQSGEYLVTPTSFEHLDGNGSPPSLKCSLEKKKKNDDSEEAALTFGGRTKRGLLDWLSYDGQTEAGDVKYGKDCITYNANFAGRYRAATHVAENFVWVNGKKVDIGMTPSGAGLKKVTIKGVNISFVFVAHRPSPYLLDTYYFDLADVVDGSVVPTLLDSRPAPPGTGFTDYIYSQPVHFCGECNAFVTSTGALLPPGAHNQYEPQGHVIRGEITVNAEGKPSVAVTAVALPTSTPVRTYRPVGADISLTGETLIVAITDTLVQVADSQEVPGEYSNSTYTQTPPSPAQGESYTVVFDISGKFGAIAGRTDVAVHLDVNGVHILTGGVRAAHTIETTTYSGHQTTTQSFYQDEYSVWTANLPTINATTTKTVELEYVARETTAFRIHDIDARFRSVVYTEEKLTQESQKLSETTVKTWVGTTTGSPLTDGEANPTTVTVTTTPGTGGPLMTTLSNCVLLPDGQLIKSEIVTAVYGIGAPVICANGTEVILANRRAATRTPGSFLASTTYTAVRSGERTASKLNPMRTLTVAMKGGAVTKTVGWPYTKKLGLPIEDTEIAMFDISLIG